jgi:hypothetical protein
MRRRSSGSAFAIIAGSVLLLAGGIVMRWRAAGEPAPRPRAVPPAGPSAVSAVSKESAPDGTPAADRPAGAPTGQEGAVGQEDPLADDPVSHGTWEALDLNAVRAAMPNNIYWAMAAPTKDPDLLKWREDERDRWNVEYGKVLSNTATAEEIDAYFAERKRLSDDYLEFVVHVLTNYSGAIPREGVSMLKLAGELHAARLEEMPRQQAEAHARREAHEAARRAWLEEQKAFQDDPSEQP